MPLLGCDGQAKICQSANQWTNRIQKTVDLGLPTWRGVDGFPAQVAGNKFVSRA